MFAYPCPFCQQRLLASPERVGQRTICPKCMKPIVIPRAEGPPSDGRITVPELMGDSPSTIFVDDFRHDEDAADGMDLSLPNDHEEFGGYVNDSGQLLPSLDAPLPEELHEPIPVSASQHVGSYTPPAMAMAAAHPMAASPHLGGVGAGPAAFVPVQEFERPSVGTRTPLPRDNGVVVFHPTAHEATDLAAELTTALTMRMKPPPEPPSDLRLSTGAWLALTAVGCCLWMLSMMRFNDDRAHELLQYVGAIGILEIVISYIWVAYLSGRKNVHRGIEALLPPVWIYRLANPCENTPGYRPLRFAVAGVILILLALLGGTLRPTVQHFTGDPEQAPPKIPKPVNSPLNLLKEAQGGGTVRQLTEALQELAAHPEAYTATPADKAQLIAELKRLRTNESGEIRGTALMALKGWTGPAAVKAELLAVLTNRKTEVHERRAALEMAKDYRDRDVTRAVALGLGFRDFLEDSDRRAADTLRAIGSPLAEEALLELFDNEDLLIRGLPNLLAELGGPKSIAELRKLAAISPSKEVREEAARTADRIASRLGIKAQ